MMNIRMLTSWPPSAAMKATPSASPLSPRLCSVWPSMTVRIAAGLPGMPMRMAGIELPYCTPTLMASRKATP